MKKGEKNNVDKALAAKGDLSEKEILLRLASETPEEEFELDLSTIYNEYKEWKRKNKGSFRDFMNSKEDPPIRRINLSNGGLLEDYADLIDAYERGIDIMPDETLTEYVNRVRRAEAKKDE